MGREIQPGEVIHLSEDDFKVLLNKILAEALSFSPLEKGDPLPQTKYKGGKCLKTTSAEKSALVHPA